jgi:hypothetical protein
VVESEQFGNPFFRRGKLAPLTQLALDFGKNGRDWVDKCFCSNSSFD